MKTLKSELLALDAASLTDVAACAAAIIKIRDGLAAMEKELFNLDTGA